MDLFIELRDVFNKFYEKCSENRHLWLEINTTISNTNHYFKGRIFNTQDSLNNYHIGVILNYAKRENIYAHANDDELNYLLTRLEDLTKKICELPKLQYNELYEKNRPKSLSHIFIGHGHDLVWARLALYLSDELRLNVVYYESDCHTGDSIDNVLQEFIDKVGLAILVFTGEDETKEGIKRARQNVIHEAGLFRSKLDSQKTIILKEKDVEIPSNLSGIEYIEFEKGKIDRTFYPLQRVLQRERYINII